MNLLRRRTLLTAPALGVTGLAGSLGWAGAAAQSADDYRALIVVFLDGGNDGINTLIPVSDAGYAAYSRFRTPSNELNIARAAALPVDLPGASERYALHPALGPLQGLVNDRKVAVIANAGTLVQPVTKQDIANGAPVPISLYSHSDQINQWNSCEYRDVGRTGWGGRAASFMTPLNAAGGVPVGVTANFKVPLMLASDGAQPINVPSMGGMRYFGLGNGAQQEVAAERFVRQAAWRSGGRHALERTFNDENRRALELSAKLHPALTDPASNVVGLFPPASGALGQQCATIARLIEWRERLGVKRQIFYAESGGYDTHGNQPVVHQNLLTQLGASLRGLYDTTVRLGVQDRVTIVVLTEFGRTFVTAAAKGTDHGWGNQQFVIGGAVRGGLVGRMPVLEPGGPDDATREGRWIPTQSLEQVGATLVRWMGLNETQIDTVFPSLSRFGSRNLGFMG